MVEVEKTNTKACSHSFSEASVDKTVE